MLRSFAPAKSWMLRQSAKRGAKKAHAILEAKIGRTVYLLWQKQRPFDARKFLASSRRIPRSHAPRGNGLFDALRRVFCGSLRVASRQEDDVERRRRHSHAERGNEDWLQ